MKYRRNPIRRTLILIMKSSSHRLVYVIELCWYLAHVLFRPCHFLLLADRSRSLDRTRERTPLPDVLNWK